MSTRHTRLPALSALLSRAAYRVSPRRVLGLLHRRRSALFEQAGSGAGVQSAARPPLATGERLAVFLGDSRAAAWTPPRCPGYRFINRGINGERSAQTLARFSHHVAPLAPDVIIIQTGVNDLWNSQAEGISRSRAVELARRNIQEIVEQSRQIHSLVILATIFPLGHWSVFERWIDWQQVQEDVAAVNAGLESLAGDGAVILDSAAALAGPDGFVLPRCSEDVLHLNSAGYQALNAALVPVLTALE